MGNIFDEIISDVLQREGGAKATNDPSDAGGRTQFGVSEKSNPKAWADGKVTEEEARAIYLEKYIKGPKLDQLIYWPYLMRQMVDYGVNSGPGVAIMALQKVLKVDQDGVMGPQTIAALGLHASPTEVNNLVMGERIKMFGRIVGRAPSQAKWVNGWLIRALDFLV